MFQFRIFTFYILILVNKTFLSSIDCFEIKKVDTPTVTDTSRRNIFRTVVHNIALVTTVTQHPFLSVTNAATTTMSTCPPRSQNCIRTTWIPPKDIKGDDAVATKVMEIFQQYPQEGQADVDKGGWSIVGTTDNGMTRLEYKSGIGNFAKYFNGGKPFTDDVLIQVVSDDDTNNNDSNSKRVEIRSASRVGDSDFGVNQKRLQYLANIARSTGWDAPDPKY